LWIIVATTFTKVTNLIKIESNAATLMARKEPYLDKSPFTAIGISYNIDPDDDRTNKEIDKDLDKILKAEGIKTETIKLDKRPDYFK